MTTTRPLDQIAREAKGSTGEDLARLTVELVRSYPEIHHQVSLAVGDAHDLAELEQERTDADSYARIGTFDLVGNRTHEATKCGTRACLAGWAIALHRGVLTRRSPNAFWEQVGNRGDGQSPSDYAANLLRVDPNVFIMDVFTEMDDEEAIKHFVRLTGVGSEV